MFGIRSQFTVLLYQSSLTDDDSILWCFLCNWEKTSFWDERYNSYSHSETEQHQQ